MSDTLKSTESIEQTEPYLKQTVDADPAETQEWLESLEYVIKSKGEDRAKYILSMLEAKARLEGVDLPMKSNTPYINTIATKDQPPYPGNREIERRIKELRSLERVRNGRKGQQEERPNWRSHLNLRIIRDALRSCFQPRLPWTR